MKIVIDIPDRIYKIIQNRTLNIMDDEILENALRNGTPLLENATNGDVIMAMFPSLTIRKQDEYVNLFIGEPILKNVLASIDEVLWDSPYKEGDEK